MNRPTLTIMLTGCISCLYQGDGGDDDLGTVAYPDEPKALSILIVPQNGWNRNPKTAPIYEVDAKSSVNIEIRRYEKDLCVYLSSGGKQIYPPKNEHDCGRGPISYPHDVLDHGGTEDICFYATIELPSVISESGENLMKIQDRTRGRHKSHKADLGEDAWLENDHDLNGCLEFGVSAKSAGKP